MGTKLKIQREVVQAPENQQWLKVAEGTTANTTGTLRGADFLAIFTDGIVPSGVVVAQLASGIDIRKMIPFSDTAFKQTITRTATGGTVALTVDGEADPVANATRAIVAATTLANITTFLESFPNVPTGSLTISGPTGGPWVVRGLPGPLVIDATNATGGTVTVANSTDADGPLPAFGHVFTTTFIGTGADVADVVVPIFWGPGAVIESKLPANHGLTAEAKADLSHIRYFA